MGASRRRRVSMCNLRVIYGVGWRRGDVRACNRCALVLPIEWRRVESVGDLRYGAGRQLSFTPPLLISLSNFAFITPDCRLWILRHVLRRRRGGTRCLYSLGFAVIRPPSAKAVGSDFTSIVDEKLGCERSIKKSHMAADGPRC